MSREDLDAEALDAGGSSVEGATTRTRAPSVLSRRMFERATRECRMSPQIATVSPSIRALVAADGQRVEQRLGRMLVRAVAGVDDRAVDFLRQQLDRAGAWWRTTMMSGRMALSVIAVSISVSPFFTDEDATDMFITSAPSRLPAISNEDCVRVEASKNRLIWVRPRSVVASCRLAVQFDEFVGEVEEADDLVARKPLDPQQMAGVRTNDDVVHACSLKPGV